MGKDIKQINPQQEKKGEKSNKKRWIGSAIITLLIVLPILIGATYFVRLNDPTHVFNDALKATAAPTADTTPEPSPEPSPETSGPTSTPTPAPATPEPYTFKQNILNVLLIGLDGSSERYEYNYKPKTDTLMLLAINFDENKVDIMSIPRDSYARVRVPEERQKAFDGQAEIKTRINEAFWAGGSFDGQGFDNTMRSIETLLGGIPIHYYAAVDMNVVKNVIDIMGGLYYDVDIHVEICEREVKEGYQKLTGQQVLDYSRVRKGYGDDFGRMDRQQRIVLAVIDQLKKADSVLKIPEYYKEVSSNTYTDLNTEQIAALALFANKLEGEVDIRRHTVPTAILPLIDKKSMLGVKQQELKALIKDIYGVSIKIDKEMDGDTLVNR